MAVLAVKMGADKSEIKLIRRKLLRGYKPCLITSLQVLKKNSEIG